MCVNNITVFKEPLNFYGQFCWFLLRYKGISLWEDKCFYHFSLFPLTSFFQEDSINKNDNETEFVWENTLMNFNAVSIPISHYCVFSIFLEFSLRIWLLSVTLFTRFVILYCIIASYQKIKLYLRRCQLIFNSTVESG